MQVKNNKYQQNPISNYYVTIYLYRSVVESQFLSMRFHANKIGLNLEKDGKIIVTGGASQNTKILQILSNVFNSPVYSSDQPQSASVGASYRAAHAFKIHSNNNQFISFHSIFPSQNDLKIVAHPDNEKSIIYDDMIKRYQKLEEKIIKVESLF